jgi:uncharacterized damage-inducible protein DinB
MGTVKFRSVDEIYAAKNAALEKIIQRIQQLDAEDRSIHIPGSSWSVADIAEHLCIVEDSLLRLISTLLKRTEDAGKTTPKIPSFEGSFQSALDRSQTEKYSTRDKFSPTGTKPVSDSLRQLQDLQGQLDGLKSRLQSVDLTYANFPHWIFGPLSLGEWLAFIGLHEERHLAQIETIIASAGFPKLLDKKLQ